MLQDITTRGPVLGITRGLFVTFSCQDQHAVSYNVTTPQTVSEVFLFRWPCHKLLCLHLVELCILLLIQNFCVSIVLFSLLILGQNERRTLETSGR